MVYGGIGKAARNWPSFDAILDSLRKLQADETLLVQSGKPVGVFRTHEGAPRVLIANSNLVPRWATWEHFNELDRAGLMMYGQMTAGSWIYIGTQGIVQGTYETFVEAGRQHYNGDLSGRWVLTAGLGGMGGAQPLAASFAGACSLNIECQQSRIDFRLRTRYVDKAGRHAGRGAGADPAPHLAQGGRVHRAVRQRRRRAARAGPARAGRRPRARTSSPTRPRRTTSSTATCPPAGSVERWQAAQQDAAQHAELTQAAGESCATHVRAMLAFHQMGVPTVDYGNNLRQVAKDFGVANAFDYPGFVPAYIRPLFCRGVGPFRWVALSGDPEDIRKTDAKMKALFPANKHLHRWLDMAQERISFQGLPARICWIGLGERHLAAWPSTRW